MQIRAGDVVRFSAHSETDFAHISKVMDVEEDGNIMRILTPMQQNDLVYFKKNVIYNMSYAAQKVIRRETGQERTIREFYKGRVKFLGNIFIEGVVMSRFAVHSEFKKVQRRGAFRSDLLLKMRFSLIPATIDEIFELGLETFSFETILDAYQGLTFSENFTKDISIGGLCFASAFEMDPESIILIQVKLESEFFLVGQVLSIQETASKTESFEYRVKFIFISEQEKELLFKDIWHTLLPSNKPAPDNE